ncbi:MAG TPA: polyphosphate kinase 2 [Gammaproteobacteria bacterium]|nr:polyphosphate kinase 2 [Gammaproteobacteria bacterium]
MPRSEPKLSHDTLEIPVKLSARELAALDGEAALRAIIASKELDLGRALANLRYEQSLERLQIELVLLNRDVQRNGRRIAIVCEGRDTAGKSSTIRRFTQFLNPRSARVAALPKPTEVERGQWYFQRYLAALPDPGEIVFFDRSWYNRAVVEPVMGFCTDAQYRTFMAQVPEVERMLRDDGIELIKLWFSISPETQAERFESRRTDPLKQWKLSPLDEKAQEHWEEYTRYIEAMFRGTHSEACPWVLVDADKQRVARLETIRYVLHALDYADKNWTGACGEPDPDVVGRYDPAEPGRAF